MGDTGDAIENTRHIAIVGGSLAGLLVGVVLKTVPHVESVTIFERSEPDRLKDQGAGIRLGPEVVDTLRKYTSFPLEQYMEPLKTLHVLGINGSDLIKIDTDNWGTSWGRIYHCLRQVFEDSDSSGVKVAYQTGCTVTGVVDEGSRLRVGLARDGQNKTFLADLVVGADGASSSLRHIVEPNSKRSYAGYVCLRGTVPTSQLSERSQDIFHQSGGLFFPEDGAQVVLYTVPSSNQDVDSGTCLNWVWYRLKTESELQDLMTDSQGTRYTYTLPMGNMREEIVQQVKKEAETGMAPQVTEVVQKTAKPFVQTVTDNMAGSNYFFGGKLLLVGDAAAGQRPHSASAMTQASFHALLLKSLLLDGMSLKQWSKEAHEFSSVLIKSGEELGKILVVDQNPVPVKMQQYWRAFAGTQKVLNEMWTESITHQSRL